MTKHIAILRVLFTIVVVLFLSCDNKSKVNKEKPNVLWLVVEDMSPLLSVYGDKTVNTPVLDQFAKESIVFTNAYSNGAQCSPARSTLISSIYAPMLATDFHREKRSVPDNFYFPKILKDNGYYCTNNRKTDYNAKNYPKDIWHSSNKKASYKNRDHKDQPFFAVFNYNGTHTKRVATRNTKNRTNRNVDLNSVSIPPYLPDVPEIRDDIAWYYDAVAEMDNWVKKKLEELEKSGEADNTIVFFYSDHGGCLPRGKAYLYDTGTRVPLMVRFPKKYQHLAQKTASNKNSNLVGFVDFAPTLLNLAGIEKPDFMMGKPFLGKNIPEPKSEIFLFRANQEQSFIPSRALTDGRYKLIWNFNAAYPNGTRQSYQWQMPSYQGWDYANIKGNVTEIQKKFWQPTAALEFFDTHNDPYEINNLVDKEEHQSKIKELKEKLLNLMKEKKDLGLYPWSMRRRKDSVPFFTYVKETKQPVTEIINAAAISSTATNKNIDQIKKYLNSNEPAIRYWGTVGVLQMLERKLIKTLPKELIANFNNTEENIEVRLMSAEAMIKANQNKAALQFVLDQVKANYFISYATLQNLGDFVKPIEKELIELRKDKFLNQFYIKSALINSGYLNYKDLWNPDI